MARKRKAEITVEPRQKPEHLDGVVIGVLMGFEGGNLPLVVFPGNRQEEAIEARTTVQLSADDIGAEVALMFEGGQPTQPVVMGRLLRPDGNGEPPQTEPAGARHDRLELNAAEEIVLKCGKASVTLTKAGKILLRGAYIFSRSTGVNKMKGGSIQLN